MKLAAKRKNSAAAEPHGTATVLDIAAQAELLGEAVVMLRAVAADVVPKFLPDGGRPPVLLLRRSGGCAGAPASVSAIVEVEAELEGLARTLEARVRALYTLRVDLAGREPPVCSDTVPSHEVVGSDERPPAAVGAAWP